MLLPPATFAGVTQKRRVWATSPPAEPVPLDRRELHRELACPKCYVRFDTYPHLGPGNVVIDNCLRCDVVWLDFGEMRQMVDAPGSDRASRHVPRVDDEYVRQGRPTADEEEHEDWLGRRRRRNHALRLMTDVLFND